MNKGHQGPARVSVNGVCLMKHWALQCLIGLLLLCGQAPVVSQSRDADAPIVVVYPRQTLPSTSINTLRAIFGMRLRDWPDQTPIRVFVLPDDNQTHNAFAKQILNIFPHQLRLAWDRLVFSGTGQAPIEVASEQEMRAKVATTPGAIGYLSKSMVNDSVRILPIQ